MLFYGEELGERLRGYSMYATGVVLTVRDTDLSTKEFSAKIDSGTQTGITLAREAMRLFRNCAELPCRNVGLRATNLKDGKGSVQLDMFSEAQTEDKMLRIEESLSSICAKFGENAVTRGTLLGRKKTFSPGFSLPSR